MEYILFSCLLFITGFASSQTIYSKAFGDPRSEPLIFIHGGSGSNSETFEATTARKLAGLGFYVIFYDRRGEGRSTDANAEYTFHQTFDDLNGIYKKYKLTKKQYHRL